jgi:hypothetical protein
MFPSHLTQINKKSFEKKVRDIRIFRGICLNSKLKFNQRQKLKIIFKTKVIKISLETKNKKTIRINLLNLNLM